ncbi:glycosyltransferase family 31 protein [Rutstroemia sp. NJR-2017a BVV2]|nr:glycosyltransferase family 31 protein [Rutstroemia sp. NJR-2017a BVV2]
MGSKACTASRASIAPDVQIVVETGGSEPQDRLQYQLATMLSNVPRQNILIFSDLEEDVESFHIHDALADVSMQERKDFPEFAIYDELQTYKQQGKDTRKLKGGWKLAKYKNLAIKRKIWKMLKSNALPKRKWYVFIDTDTFVEWDNLLAMLEHFNPRKNLYMGSPVWANPKAPFAHGGSGYVLSYSALEALNMPDRGGYEGAMYSQFGFNTSATCCGDDALAKVLKPKGIGLKGYWPMFNGEVPATLGFGSEIWCEPVLSLHHISGKDMENLWQWVEDWRARTMSMQPFLFKDLFQYIAPQFVSRMNDWDNTEEGWKIYYHPSGKKEDSLISFEQCEAACQADKDCFQFVSHGTTCALSHTIRIGRQRLAEEKGDYGYISGWNLERIRDWTRKTGIRGSFNGLLAGLEKLKKNPSGFRDDDGIQRRQGSNRRTSLTAANIDPYSTSVQNTRLDNYATQTDIRGTTTKVSAY